MFDGISMSDYILDFDLQKAYFLRDCLKEEISYKLKKIGGTWPREDLIIYKKSDNGISEEITLDELIFYIHTEIAELIKNYKYKNGPLGRDDPNPEHHFFHIFKDIDTINKAVKNMKIILKYDNESSDEDNGSEEDNGSDEDNESSDEDNESSDEGNVELDIRENLLRQLRPLGGPEAAWRFRNEEFDVEKIEDNETLAF